MIKKVLHIIVFIVLAVSVKTYAQQQDSIPLSEQYIIFEGDTLLIELDEIVLLKKLKFKDTYDRRYYYWFRKKTLNAYPFAKIAAERLEVLNERLENIKSKRKKKVYIKRIQKYMEGEFADQLKKLTRTEGRILIKLIHRQTGKTVFDLVKDYRSGWNAFWYNSTAKVFKLSLKSTYNPLTNNEDYLIEDILQRAFIDGILEEQDNQLNFDYLDLEAKTIDVERPKQKKRKKKQ
ncbi:MAG TPA: DUF4294 domain-containing protein [Flavobacteriaceae bacterium]|nr:DUF4294 domain-containing protein [Flavobacteriaceae bacterium]